MRNGDDGRAAKAPPPPPSDAFDENSSKLAAELFESSDFPETPSRPVNLPDGASRPSSGFGGDDELTRVFEMPPGNLAETLANEDEKPYDHVPEGATSVMQLDPEMLKMLQDHRDEAARRAAQEDVDSSAIAANAASAMEVEHAGNRRRPLQDIVDEPSTPRSQTPFTDDAFGMPDGGSAGGFDNEPTGQMAMPPMGLDTSKSAAPSFSLPDIDFSMPADFGTPSASSSYTPSTSATSATTNAELPAHLQLPNFPEFDMPKAQTASDVRRHIADDASIEGNLGGSFGSMEGTPNQQSSAADGWAVAPAAGAMIPPPTPRRMGATGSQSQANKVLGDGLPVLPNIALPSMHVAAPKKEPTLIGAERAEMLATEHKKSMTVPIIVISILLVATGAALFVYKDVVVARVFGVKQTEAVETPTDKARKLTAVGQAAYDSGQYQLAVDNFRKALDQDAMFAKAQRSLGIAYAKLNQPDEAVNHYRIYLALAPTAEDAGEVKKIIQDYDIKAAAKALEDKAKAEKDAADAAEKEKADAAAKAKKSRRR